MFIPLIPFCIFSLILIIYYLKMWWIHMHTKEYFWGSLANEQKEVVNYVGHRQVLWIKHLTPKNREVIFLKKRNQILTELDPEQAQKLIRAERNLCICEYIFCLLFLFFFSFPRKWW